jgi:hypothetical protein
MGLHPNCTNIKVIARGAQQAENNNIHMGQIHVMHLCVWKIRWPNNVYAANAIIPTTANRTCHGLLGSNRIPRIEFL